MNYNLGSKGYLPLYIATTKQLFKESLKFIAQERQFTPIRQLVYTVFHSGLLQGGYSTWCDTTITFMTNRRIFNSYYFLSKTPEMIHWNDMLGHRNKQEATFILTCMGKIALLDFGTSMDDSSSQTIRTQLQNSLLFYNPITGTNIAHAFNIQTASPQLKKISTISSNMCNSETRKICLRLGISGPQQAFENSCFRHLYISKANQPHQSHPN